MKNFSKKIILVLLVASFTFWACQKPLDDLVQLPTVSIDSVKNKVNNLQPKCTLIKYSDTLFYLKNQKDDLKIEPLEKYEGLYGAYPEGLEINNSNGEINLTESESGLKYKVYFVPKNTTDTCFTNIIISGIDYLSKIYVLDNADTLVNPIYNSNINLAIPGARKNGDDGGGDDNSGSSGGSSGSGSNDDDENDNEDNDKNKGEHPEVEIKNDNPTQLILNEPIVITSPNLGQELAIVAATNSTKNGGSEFDDDDDDDNGNGTLDEPLPGQSVILQGLAIEKSNGKISLKKSIKNGVFGGNPKSGDTKKLKIYYRLDDNSGKALNKIEIQLHYYTNLAEVPKSLKDKIEQNQHYLKGGKYSALTQGSNMVRKPRPPEIVIVGRYQ